MKIIYTKSYDNTLKDLKKYPKEKNKLQEIIELVEDSTDFLELKANPIASLYDFERLKHNLNEFYSFRLNNAKIRLIVLPDKSDLKINFVYISYDHYLDFNKKKVIYYDE